ncbi:hypothetical protein [Maribacter sp.]|uniref:hypothetical protein n=1 Tax=Maribacter sp. TaxID=1897614 RepID=UPI0025C18563|nr:hypothetical protein [Maribacter sp.]
MRIIFRMKINIKLDKRSSGKTEEGYPIVISFQKTALRTGYYSKPAHWNNNLSEPKKSHPDYYFLSDFLDPIKSRIKNIIKESRLKNISKNEIKAALFKKDSKVFYTAAMNLFPEKYRGTDWSAVRSFNNFRPSIYFTEITKETSFQYSQSLLKKGNKPAGVDSYIRSLKSVWTKLSNAPNPFKGINIEIPDKVNTVATTEDIKKLKQFRKDHTLYYQQKNEYNQVIKTTTKKAARSIGNGGFINYCNYWLLMFYLGGIDPEVLAKLRYDKHVINNRIVFNRNKGRSKTSCNNIIPSEAWEILKNYTSQPYLVPIYKTKNYDTFSTNFSERMKIFSDRLCLSVRLKPKSGRYTFIDRAQQLLIDERIAGQIVGHKRKTTTSLYANDFPYPVQDKAHLKIIDTTEESLT